MKAAIDQLYTNGEQERFLVQKPSLNFFKKPYERHHNFSIETIPTEFEQHPNFGFRYYCTVEKSRGDLLGKCYLRVKLPPLTIPVGSTYVGWTNSLMHALVEEIGIDIGGRTINAPLGRFLDVDDEFSLDENKVEGYEDMIGKYSNALSTHTNATGNNEYYMKIPLWFCGSSSNYLPLASLYKTEIRFFVKFRNFIDVVTFDGNTDPDPVSISEASIVMDYIHLGKDDRDKLLCTPSFYLIEQMQHTEFSVDANLSKISHRLKFYHPVKCLYFTANEIESENNNDYFHYANRTNGNSLIETIAITTEGNVRVEEMTEAYFRQVEASKYQRKIPDKYIYAYSFSLCPYDQTQPSGHINFSMYDYVDLQFGMRRLNPNLKIDIYGINWNILIVDPRAKDSQVQLKYES